MFTLEQLLRATGGRVISGTARQDERFSGGAFDSRPLNGATNATVGFNGQPPSIVRPYVKGDPLADNRPYPVAAVTRTVHP